MIARIVFLVLIGARTTPVAGQHSHEDVLCSIFRKCNFARLSALSRARTAGGRPDALTPSRNPLRERVGNDARTVYAVGLRTSRARNGAGVGRPPDLRMPSGHLASWPPGLLNRGRASE